MRVWHFVNAKYGLDDIRRRRLKIALISDLNDPFEFLAFELSSKNLRRALEGTKDTMARTKGLLCFSRDWRNPVQWSHYADRHRGICLGFDVPDSLLVQVSYTAERLAVEVDKLFDGGPIGESTMLTLLSTKYEHWKYENEVRCFLGLEDKDPESGLYFADFSDKLRLLEVIVGARSGLSRRDITDALGSLTNVEAFKARPAFKTFTVVRNRDASLWL